MITLKGGGYFSENDFRLFACVTFGLDLNRNDGAVANSQELDLCRSLAPANENRPPRRREGLRDGILRDVPRVGAKRVVEKGVFRRLSPNFL